MKSVQLSNKFSGTTLTKATDSFERYFSKMPVLTNWMTDEYGVPKLYKVSYDNGVVSRA